MFIRFVFLYQFLWAPSLFYFMFPIHAIAFTARLKSLMRQILRVLKFIILTTHIWYNWLNCCPIYLGDYRCSQSYNKDWHNSTKRYCVLSLFKARFHCFLLYLWLALGVLYVDYKGNYCIAISKFFKPVFLIFWSLVVSCTL